MQDLIPEKPFFAGKNFSGTLSGNGLFRSRDFVRKSADGSA